MSDPPSSLGDLGSAADCAVGSGVDDFDAGRADDAHPFTTPESERYRTDGALGQGGMGVVEVVFDRRLQRQVARKHGRPGGASDRRLAQEAWITAQLDHPGIIAVHDAGRGQDGALSYTMPLVRGQTLATALEGATASGGLSLLRHLRDACEAVGYAHQQGFVHRDLKPNNIMVGAFGETRVMDWGLARPTPGASEARWHDHLPHDHLARTREGAVLGTPLYMSPEQAAGEPVGPESDVWSLGVILYELLCGTSPFAADSERRVLAAILTGSRPPLRDRAPEAPAPLIAITERALSLDPADRYPTAKALADDLSRWMEGRRVDAHQYTAVERASRVLTALRLPLAVGAVALLLGTVATGLFAWKAQVQATLAAEAREEAEQTAQRSEAHLQQALVSRALVAFAEQDRGTAELLAARALTIAEDAHARGILAGWPDAPRPMVVADVAAPRCEGAALDPTGRLLACTLDGALSLWSTDPLQKQWQHDIGAAFYVSVAQSGRVAVALEGATRVYTADGALALSTVAMLRPQSGADADIVWGTDHGVMAIGLSDTVRLPLTRTDTRLVRRVEPCGEVLAVETDRWAAACVGKVVRHDGARRVERPLPPLDEIGDPTVLSLGEGSVTVGTLESKLVQLHWPSGDVAWRLDLDQGAVVSLARTTDGTRIAALLERGGVLLIEAQTGRLITRLPPQPRARMLAIDGEDVLTVVGTDVRRYRLPAASPGSVWRVPGGVNDLELKPDGTELAAAYGGGWSRWSWPDGQLLSRRSATCVARDLDWTADSRLVVGLALPGCVDGHQGGVLVDGTPPSTALEGLHGVRRVSAIGADLIGIIAYGTAGPWAVSLESGQPAPSIAQPDGAPVSIENTVDAGMIVWSGPGGVWRYEVGDTAPTPVWDRFDAGPVAVEAQGRFAVVATDGAVHRLDPRSGQVAWSTPTPDISARDLAVAPNGRWVALAARDGTTRVFDAQTGVLRAVFRGHTEQVAAVAFGPESRHLFTGSWDDTVRIWDVAVLDADPNELHAQLADNWRLDLGTLLQPR